MNIAQIEENVQKLLKPLNNETFIYDLLQAYGKPKASIGRLKNGTYNLSKNKNEVLWKKQLFFVSTDNENLLSLIDDVRKNDPIIRHQPRFIVVTNFKTLLAVDTKTQDTLDIEIHKLGKNFDFFLPWAGMEKAQQKNENPADVKAAEKMAKLYDETLKDNPVSTNEELHLLNVFLSRLLFCFFAEDTEIFPKGSFTNSIKSHTQGDGSDLDTYLKKLFEVLNNSDRSQYPQYLQAFPYVNGGLFTDKIFAPKFSRRSRTLIIECGELDWSAINPDIFGSMFQAVVHIDQRAEMGMHYTSVPNIMKVIEPLFLNELKEEFENHYEHENKLERLLLRLENLKIFDPACGSGNFLIIAYKEIRTLEMKILQRINQLSKNKAARFSNITLTQFYGIELDDFAHEIAILSLWLAEHQMNVKFKEVFGAANPSLPLKSGGYIVCGNAARLDWKVICPKNDENEVYILGNPPYLGARQQDKKQKEDLNHNLQSIKGCSDLDYISIWFYKASAYTQFSNSKYGFVSTNSISQGIQVSSLWPAVLMENLEIYFAHKSFKWINNAKKNAGVTCVIIGVRNKSSKVKYIYDGNLKSEVSNINCYLVEGKNIFVEARKTPLSNLPPVNYGSFALDDGNFTLSSTEKFEFESKNPELSDFIRPFVGAHELIQGSLRYCLWLAAAPENIRNIDAVRLRIARVQLWRSSSDREATRKLASIPHYFAEVRQPNCDYIAFPTVSSERREYIPVSFLSQNIIASNQIYVLPNALPWHFGVLTSKMHMVWIKAVGGRLKTDYRYSSAVCYNTFPIPKLIQSSLNSLSESSLNLLRVRELYSEKSLAELYDPDKIPDELQEAHKKLDFAVEQCYRSKPFSSDEERLEYLFKLYEEMTVNEKRKTDA